MSRSKRSLRSAAWLAAVTLVLVAFLAPAVTSAWTAPAVTALCAPDADHYEFTVSLSGSESNYNFDWSFGSSGPWTTVAGHAGTNDLIVVRGTGDLWVRWTSDQGVMAHASPNGTLCGSASPSASAPVQSESLPPSASASASPTGSVLPTASAATSPSATAPVQSESIAPSHSASPSGTVLGETGAPTLTPPPTDSVARSTPTADSWRLMLLGMAALLAIGLLALRPTRHR